MAGFLDLKRQTSILIGKSLQLATDFNYATSVENIKCIKTAFKKKELLIVTVGEAKRGKSSLLNAILNETEPLFPVDMNVCTNVVTIVRYGEKESIEVYFEDPLATNKIRRKFVERKDIADYVSEKGNPDNYKNIKSLQIAIPNKLLKEGVVFVDTPGVGSLNVAHAETTYSFLPNADIVLFVSDVGSGYTESELNFLKKSYKYCKNIIFPVTKKDTSINYQVIVDDNINKITDTLGIPAEDVQIIPVSSTAKLHYLNSGNKSMYTNSNFKELENAIWTTIAKNRAEILLRPFINDISQEINRIYNSILTQTKMLTADQNKVNALINAYNKEKEQVEKYQDKHATWRNDLSLFFQKLSIENNNEIQDILTEATDKLDTIINQKGIKICKESNYLALLSEINDVLGAGYVETKDSIENSVFSQVNKIKKQLSLDTDINAKALNRIQFLGDNNIDIKYEKKKITSRIISGGRNISMNAMGGAVAGSVIGAAIGTAGGFVIASPISGGFLGSTIGSLIGGVLGGAKGCIESLKKHSTVDVGTVRKEFSKYINSAIRKLKSTISLVNIELQKQMLNKFDSDLKSRINEIKENMTRINNNLNIAKADIPNKQKALRYQNDAVKTLDNALVSLDNELSAFADQCELGNGILSEENVKVKNTNLSNDENKSGQDGDSISYGFL